MKIERYTNILEEQQEDRFVDLDNAIFVSLEDREWVIWKEKQWLEKQKTALMNGDLTAATLQRIEKGKDIEKEVLNFLWKNKVFGEIKQLYKTTTYDDYKNHIDGLAEMIDEEFFGLSFDITFTGEDNFENLKTKFKYTKNNLDEGHLTNVKYGPHEKPIQNIPRIILSLNKRDENSLKHNNIDSTELSLKLLWQVDSQIKKFDAYIWNKLDLIERMKKEENLTFMKIKKFNKESQKIEEKQQFLSFEGLSEYEEKIRNIQEIYWDFSDKIIELLKKRYQEYKEQLSRGNMSEMEAEKKLENFKIEFLGGEYTSKTGRKLETDGQNVNLEMALINVFSGNEQEKVKLREYKSKRV